MVKAKQGKSAFAEKEIAARIMKRFVKCFFNLLTDSPAQLISKD